MGRKQTRGKGNSRMMSEERRKITGREAKASVSHNSILDRARYAPSAMSCCSSRISCLRPSRRVVCRDPRHRPRRQAGPSSTRRSPARCCRPCANRRGTSLLGCRSSPLCAPSGWVSGRGSKNGRRDNQRPVAQNGQVARTSCMSMLRLFAMFWAICFFRNSYRSLS